MLETKFPKTYLKVFVFALIAGFYLNGCSTDAMNPMGGADEEQQSGNESEENSGADPSLNQKPTGTSYEDLLTSNTYQELVVEIFYMPGMEPTAQTLDQFEDFLQERLNKPQGISLELKEIPSGNEDTYSIIEITNLEKDIRTQYNKGDKIAVFAVFLDAPYAGNTENGTVLGVAYQNTSFAMFESSVREFSNRPFAPSRYVLESTVLNHEFGHLMGLVNAGTPLQSEHQDVEHGRHCTAENCLMYWTAETGEGLLSTLTGGSIPSLDSACLEDLRAAGGK